MVNVVAWITGHVVEKTLAFNRRVGKHVFCGRAVGDLGREFALAFPCFWIDV